MNKDDIRDQINQIWGAIVFPQDAENIAKVFPTKASEFLIFLMFSLFLEDSLTIGTFDENLNRVDNGSFVSLDEYDKDKWLHLKYGQDSKFILEFSYYDSEGEFQVVTSELSNDELRNIPEGLRNLMIESRDKMETIIVAGKELK